MEKLDCTCLWQDRRKGNEKDGKLKLWTKGKQEQDFKQIKCASSDRNGNGTMKEEKRAKELGCSVGWGGMRVSFPQCRQHRRRGQKASVINALI